MRRDIQVIFQDPAASLIRGYRFSNWWQSRCTPTDSARPTPAFGLPSSSKPSACGTPTPAAIRRNSPAGRAAHRDRAGVGAAAQNSGARRTRVRTRRVDSGWHPQPVARPAARIRSVIFVVSHNLSVVKHLAHQVVVMLRGVVVEQGDSDEVFSRPQHEYTRRLLAAVPQPDSAVARRLGPVGPAIVFAVSLILGGCSAGAESLPPGLATALGATSDVNPQNPARSATSAVILRLAAHRISRPTSTLCTSTATPPMSAAC